MEDNDKIISVFQVLIAFFVCIFFYVFFRRDKKREVIDKIPGPRAIPFFGNALQFLGSPSEGLKKAINVCNYDKSFIRVWILNRPYIIIYKASAAEVILHSNKCLDKSSDYKSLRPWLGTGLLTSTGSKWHQRRKMLTPTFHFKILEDYVEIFNQQSQIFVKNLQSNCDGKPFDIYPRIILCTLDIIMETAMGKKFYAQNNSSSEYVKAIYIICLIFMEKQARPWMQVSLIANLLGRAKMEEECLKILHGLSNETIKDRRKKREELRLSGTEKNSGKKRMSFLDLLLEYSEDHEILSDEDIREEVDTFMFEGHDTTAASVNWTLYLLGQHPEIQDKAYEEIESIFGSSDRDATSSDIREMKYLECCIKESLRLFPSVPAFGRELNEDVIIEGYTVPKGTSTMIFVYQLHRDPEVFPDPNTYKPERFFPENYANRSPYAYIPFSAGPRNCIGQKFALMEEKVILSTFLRNYRVESILKMEELNVAPEVILRNETENLMKIFPRH
ncbi:UNVERIFIED_CONTAM: hypothetical protein RMT77_002249 [Armadillidium vulgare]